MILVRLDTTKIKKKTYRNVNAQPEGKEKGEKMEVDDTFPVRESTGDFTEEIFP